MALITYDRYVTLSGDSTTASAAIEESIDEAERLVSDFLNRPLEEGTYTEQLFVEADGFSYPSAVPITSVPASADIEIYDDVALRCGAGLDFITAGQWDEVGGYQVQLPRAAITYTGGWTAASVPFGVASTIARLAYAMANPTPFSDDTGGATSKKVGDVSVTYGAGGAAGPAPGRGAIDALVPGGTSQIKVWRFTEDYS